MQRSKHRISISGRRRETKLHSSMFFLTINSQRTLLDPNPNTKYMELDPVYIEFSDRVYKVLEKMGDYTKVNKGKIPDDDMKITIDESFEIGPKLHRLHCHVIVDIKHNSNIHIDTQKIQDAIPNSYVSAEYIRGNDDIEKLLAYLRDKS